MEKIVSDVILLIVIATGVVIAMVVIVVINAFKSFLFHTYERGVIFTTTLMAMMLVVGYLIGTLGTLLFTYWY